METCHYWYSLTVFFFPGALFIPAPDRFSFIPGRKVGEGERQPHGANVTGTASLPVSGMNSLVYLYPCLLPCCEYDAILHCWYLIAGCVPLPAHT